MKPDAAKHNAISATSGLSLATAETAMPAPATARAEAAEERAVEIGQIAEAGVALPQSKRSLRSFATASSMALIWLQAAFSPTASTAKVMSFLG